MYIVSGEENLLHIYIVLHNLVCFAITLNKKGVQENKK